MSLNTPEGNGNSSNNPLTSNLTSKILLNAQEIIDVQSAFIQDISKDLSKLFNALNNWKNLPSEEVLSIAKILVDQARNKAAVVFVRTKHKQYYDDLLAEEEKKIVNE